MNKVRISNCAAIVAATLLIPTIAAQSPWDGTWKLNRDKSKVTGSTFTLTAKPDGSMHYSNNATVEYDFACDGKDYPVLADRTFACTKAGDNAIDTTAKRAGGETLSTSHRELSADGKTVTITTKGTHPDGTSYTTTTKFTRTAGTSGWAGTWKSVDVSSNNPGVMQLAVQNDTLHISDPNLKDNIEAKLDGTDAPVVGPTVPPGLTYSYKADGPNKLHFIEKLSGKSLFEGDQTLSADGKTITEVNWIPGKPAEKQTLVFEKQ